MTLFVNGQQRIGAQSEIKITQIWGNMFPLEICSYSPDTRYTFTGPESAWVIRRIRDSAIERQRGHVEHQCCDGNLYSLNPLAAPSGSL